MKTIYLVRHGESEGNAKRFMQFADTPLTDHGHSQAELVAKRCAHLGFERLICSTQQRAQQTAAAIQRVTPQPLTSSELFMERRRPSKHDGLSHDDPGAKAEIEQWWEHFGEPGFKIADEETFFDLKERGLQALHFLESQPEETLLVVTHGLFSRVLLACILFGGELSAFECKRIMRGFQTKNTGLGKIIFDDTLDPPHWLVAIWNDHAHLGE